VLDAVARELLDAPNVAHVVTRRPGGRPRVVVVWVARRGDDVLLNVRADRAWLRDVRADPAVVVTVVDLRDPYRYVTVEGPAVPDDVDAQAAYAELARKYFGDVPPPPGDRVALRVPPERVRVYHAR
jgi:PPOX class probable F420-dependent enzyme